MLDCEPSSDIRLELWRECGHVHDACLAACHAVLSDEVLSCSGKFPVIFG